MVPNLEPAYTKVRVLSIQELGKQGKHMIVKATVEHWELGGTVMEYSCTYTLDGFRPLDGAKAALEVFQRKKDDEEDKEDGIFSNCLASVRSYITSYFTSIIPAKRSNRIDNVLQCKPSTPDTQRPASRHDNVENQPQSSSKESWLRPYSQGYQCRMEGCKETFTLPESCMFHEEKHRETGSSYYESSRKTTDPGHTLSNTTKGIHSSTAPTQQTRRPGSSDSGQTLVQWVSRSLDTQTQSLSQLLAPSVNSTPSDENFKMSRCFILRVLGTAKGVYVRLLAGTITKDGTRIVRPREMKWEALKNYWGIQLEEHMGKQAYEKAMSKPRVETGTELLIFAAQQIAKDVGLTPKQCRFLLKGNSLFLSERTDILDIPWIFGSP